MKKECKLNITFSSKNGAVPNYTYKNKRFTIRDKRIKEIRDRDEWVFYLAVEDLTTKTITFEDHKKAMEYMNNLRDLKGESKNGWKQLRYEDETEQKYLYSDSSQDYFIIKNILTIRNRPVRITADYDKYYECLRDAKEYVRKYIKKVEPEQLKL